MSASNATTGAHIAAGPASRTEYKGRRCDGLIANRGERLCPACCDAQTAAEGADILVVDDRPGIPPYIYNTVRDRDVIHIQVPPELRGYDGRDMSRLARKRRGR